MKNIVDICHGKFFRAVVTEDGKLFWQGQSRRYMMGWGSSISHHQEKFYRWDDHDNNGNYFSIEAGDKIVGCAGGKNFLIVMTKNGKVYATSYMFFRYFSGCRHQNRSSDEDYPFEIRMPDGWKARKIFGMDKDYNMWATCENAEG